MAAKKNNGQTKTKDRMAPIKEQAKAFLFGILLDNRDLSVDDVLSIFAEIDAESKKQSAKKAESRPTAKRATPKPTAPAKGKEWTPERGGETRLKATRDALDNAVLKAISKNTRALQIQKATKATPHQVRTSTKRLKKAGFVSTKDQASATKYSLTKKGMSKKQELMSAKLAA